MKSLIFFDYELKIEWIVKIDKFQKYHFTNYIGLKFFHDNSYYEEFRTDNQILLKELKEILKKRMNQSNFRDFYKPLKKIGRGSGASVSFFLNFLLFYFKLYLMEEKETEKAYVVKFVDKEAYQNNPNGKVDLFFFKDNFFI